MPTAPRIAAIAPAAALATVMLAVLGGCSLGLDPTSAIPPKPPTGSPSAAPIDRDGPFLVDAAIGEVVATGTLVGRAAPELEGIEVTVTLVGEPALPEGLTWLVTLADVPEGHYGFGAAGDLDLDSRCAEESDRAYAFGDLGVGNDPAESVFALDDPTWITSVFLAIVDPADRSPSSSCLQPLAAIAMLDWSIDPARPDLDPIDGGPQTGAMGDVVVDQSGVGRQYLIAAGDGYRQIAERFGLTPAELDYLNPASDWSSARDQLEIGCTLNLRLDSRADHGTCVAA